MSAGRALVLGACLLGLGCPSAYQRTYDAEMQRLDSEQQARDAAARAAHAEASRFAAVVYFDSGSASLQEDGRRQLRWLVGQLEPYPEAVLLVQGFADATGGDALNEGLARERASAVAAYLESQGLQRGRLEVQGFGADFAAASNQTAKGRRSNRRVEVTVK